MTIIFFAICGKILCGKCTSKIFFRLAEAPKRKFLPSSLLFIETKHNSPPPLRFEMHCRHSISRNLAFSIPNRDI